MKTRAVIGAVLLVVGIISLIIGLNASDSAADQITQTFTGHFTDKTSWYIMGGAGALVAGVVLLGVESRGRFMR